jgi:hypothetical protein
MTIFRTKTGESQNQPTRTITNTPVTIAMRAFFDKVVIYGILTLFFPCASFAAKITFQPSAINIPPGEQRLVTIHVDKIPPPGLTAFQLSIQFNPAIAKLSDPNSGFKAFTPLGNAVDASICETLRKTSPCPDPPWMLISTGRSPVVASATVDNVKGTAQIVYGSSAPPATLAIGSGVLAILRVTGMNKGSTSLVFSDVKLLDDTTPIPNLYPTTSGTLQLTVNADSDVDGVSDKLESQIGTEPANPDSDSDALPEGFEIGYDENILDLTANDAIR